MELRGPQNFHEAAMFVKQVDAMITRVSGQDTRKSWQKGYKGGLPQQHHAQVKSSGGETSASGFGGPEPMELGVARRRTLSRDKCQKLCTENVCFYCRKRNAGHIARDYPLKKKKSGNAASH